MEDADKEIIDLTKTDEPEVIVLDCDVPSSSPTQRSRVLNGKHKAAREEDTEVVAVENDVEQQVPKSSKKSKRTRKKRKRTVVGAEDGEIVEAGTANTSAQVSGEGSSDKSETEERRTLNIVPTVERKKGDGEERISLLARLGAIPVAADAESQDVADEQVKSPQKAKAASKSGKKRKKREQQRESQTFDEKDPIPSPSGDPPPYFIDDRPSDVSTFATALPPPVLLASSATIKANGPNISEETTLLLLPPHVSVIELNGDTPIVEIKAPVPDDSEDEDYIDYVEYDDDRVKGTTRYFDPIDEDDEVKATKSTRLVCKRCGAENQHKTYDCPVLVCLTCGVRDEHSTRSCPISKICFTCGMKGHINRDCPNRYNRRTLNEVYEDCGRCGSTDHKTGECPTLWRIYEYVSDAERKTILDERERKSALAFGEGGEGYIGPEDWCYNCGSCGHMGDDCRELSFPHDHPREPSAFGEHNTRSGPFADTKPGSRPQSKAALYAQKADEAWGDGHGSVLPLDVGRQAKQKEKARMQKRAQEMQEDDGEDWFANRAGGPSKSNSGRSGRSTQASRNGRSDGKSISFGDFSRDDDRYGRDRRDRDRERVRDRDRRDWRDSRDKRDDRDRRSRDGDSSYWDGLPQPSRESDSIQIRGASRKGSDAWGVSIRGAASRYDDREPDSRDELYERRRHERSRDARDRTGRMRDRREASPRREPRYRGGYSR